MKFIEDKDGKRWAATRCDYRHRGKRKRRYILRQCGRSGALLGPVKFVDSITAP